jgi:hypothetical protein
LQFYELSKWYSNDSQSKTCDSCDRFIGALWLRQRIRMQLGGCQSMLEPFPNRPKGMHWRTYDRLRRAHDVADARFVMGMMRFVDRVQRRAPSSGRR